MESEGNLRSKEKYEQCVPSCYKRPTAKDPQYVLKFNSKMRMWIS